MGFWDSMAMQVVGGRAAHLRGKSAGEAEALKHREAEAERARQERLDQQQQVLNALREEEARLSIEQKRNPYIDVAGRRFPDTPEGRAAADKYEEERAQRDHDRDVKLVGARSRASAENARTAADRRSDSQLERNRERTYWEKVAEDLVRAHGNQAANVAARQDRPELRRARQQGLLTYEMLRAAQDRITQQREGHTYRTQGEPLPDALADQYVREILRADPNLSDAEVEAKLIERARAGNFYIPQSR